LDIEQRVNVIRIIKRFSAQYQKTVYVIEHDIMMAVSIAQDSEAKIILVGVGLSDIPESMVPLETPGLESMVPLETPGPEFSRGQDLRAPSTVSLPKVSNGSVAPTARGFRACHVSSPMNFAIGINKFLESLGITIRMDATVGRTVRPRINKLNSQKDREQKASRKFFD
jgi:translation initiation factor RLI1